MRGVVSALSCEGCSCTPLWCSVLCFCLLARLHCLVSCFPSLAPCFPFIAQLSLPPSCSVLSSRVVYGHQPHLHPLNDLFSAIPNRKVIKSYSLVHFGFHFPSKSGCIDLISCFTASSECATTHIDLDHDSIHHLALATIHAFALHPHRFFSYSSAAPYQQRTYVSIAIHLHSSSTSVSVFFLGVLATLSCVFMFLA